MGDAEADYHFRKKDGRWLLTLEVSAPTWAGVLREVRRIVTTMLRRGAPYGPSADSAEARVLRDVAPLLGRTRRV